MGHFTSSASALLVLLLASSCYGQTDPPESETSDASTDQVAKLQFDFDCRRHGVGCGNAGRCNLDTGACGCGDAGTFNYMCDNFTESASCDPLCENGGKCVNDKCVCGPNNYGDTCQMMRVQLQCEAQKMFVNINPHGNFSGRIYLNDEPDCELIENQGAEPSFSDYVKNPEDLEGWRLEVPHKDDRCGDAVVNSTTDSQSSQLYTSYNRQFFIQYNELFKSSVDQLITAECKVSNGSATVYGDVNDIADFDGNYPEVNVDDEVQVVTLEILDENDDPVGEEVMLGQQIKLVFTMIEGSGFTDFRLASCKANNTIDPSVDSGNFSEVEFVKDGCPTSEASALFSGDTVKSSSPSRWTVNMKAFMFTGISQKVAFVCSVVFCDNSSLAECGKKTCEGYSAGATGDGDTPSTVDNGNGGDNDTDTEGGDDTSVDNGNGATTGDTAPAEDGGNDDNSGTPGDTKRKRRAAANEETVSKVINVHDPLTEVKKVLESEKEAKKESKRECIEEPSVMAAVIVLAVCVVLLLVLCAILLYRLMRSRHKVAAHRPGTFAEPVQSMRIPRLELHNSPYA